MQQEYEREYDDEDLYVFQPDKYKALMERYKASEFNFFVRNKCFAYKAQLTEKNLLGEGGFGAVY